jgi:hypothetical protein
MGQRFGGKRPVRCDDTGGGAVVEEVDGNAGERAGVVPERAAGRIGRSVLWTWPWIAKAAPSIGRGGTAWG